MTTTEQTGNIATISELLKLSGSQYRLYDIGRLVTKLPKDIFEKVELNQLPYPTPVQGHACFAIAFWQKHNSQPYLWLLKLPLDERGLLNQGARNHLIAIIVEALGADLTQEASKKQEDLLSSNPYLYTPAQYKLASLNSKIKVDLKQPPSDFYFPFLSYLKQGDYKETWQHLGVQGITDFIARINQDNNSVILQKALPSIPNEVLSPVCGALENEKYPIALLNELITLFKHNLTQDTETGSATDLLRSLAAISQHTFVKEAVKDLLTQSHVSTDLLITLSGRCWQALDDEDTLACYFEQLLQHNDLSLFSSIFKDLVSIPLLRPTVFKCIRSENRTQTLSNAIGQLFN